MKVTFTCGFSLEELSFAVKHLTAEGDSYAECVALDTAERLLRDIKTAVADTDAGADEDN